MNQSSRSRVVTKDFIGSFGRTVFLFPFARRLLRPPMLRSIETQRPVHESRKIVDLIDRVRLEEQGIGVKGSCLINIKRGHLSKH